MLRFILLITGTLLFTHCALASEFSPAKFQSGDKSLSAQINFPERLSDGKLQVRCAGYAMSRGALSYVRCNYKSPLSGGTKQAIREVQKAAHIIRLLPARIDGVGKNVRFNFSVLFIKDGTREEIQVSENHLLDDDQLIDQFTSPQRIVKITEGWYPVGCANRMLLSVDINDQGKASNSKIISSSTPESENCRSRLFTMLHKSEYIPATQKGKRVNSLYEERFRSSK